MILRRPLPRHTGHFSQSFLFLVGTILPRHPTVLVHSRPISDMIRAALPHWLHPPIGMVIGSSPTHWASSANQRKPLPSRAAAPEELRAVLDRIEANGRGKPIGEQVLADAHRRHAENDCPNRRD